MIREIVTEIERKISPLMSRILYPAPGANTLIREKDKILVLNTGKTYRFPGGLVKAGEHPEDTAKRELIEETGLEADIQNLELIKPKFNGITATHFFYSAALTEEFSEASTWEGKTELIEEEKLPEKMKKIIEKTGI